MLHPRVAAVRLRTRHGGYLPNRSKKWSSTIDEAQNLGLVQPGKAACGDKQGYAQQGRCKRVDKHVVLGRLAHRYGRTLSPARQALHIWIESRKRAMRLAAADAVDALIKPGSSGELPRLLGGQDRLAVAKHFVVELQLLFPARAFPAL